MHYQSKALLLLLIPVFFCQKIGATPVDFQSARTLSMGGGGRGGAVLTDTIVLNPALLSFQALQGLSATYSWQRIPPVVPAAEDQRVLQAAVIDGKNQYAQAGLSFTRRTDLDLIHLSVAHKLTETLALGISGKRFSTRPRFADRVHDHTGYDAGVSAAFIPAPASVPFPFQIGVTVDNLIRDPKTEPFLGGRRYGMGAKASLKDIVYLYGDFVYVSGNTSETAHFYTGTAELNVGSDIYIRGSLLGFQQSGWAAGASWMGPRLGLSYGYQKLISPSHGFEHAVTVDFYM